MAYVPRAGYVLSNTDPAQLFTTAGEELDDLDHYLSDLSDVWIVWAQNSNPYRGKGELRSAMSSSFSRLPPPPRPLVDRRRTKVIDKRMSGLSNPVVGTCSVAMAPKMPWNDEGYQPPQVTYVIIPCNIVSCDII